MTNDAHPPTVGTQALRVFAWAMIAATFTYLFNNWLVVWQSWPGAAAVLVGDFSIQGVAQIALYILALAAPIYLVNRHPVPLREEAARMSAITNFIIRAAFWAVFLIGLADAIISFLRVEEMLPGLIGQELSDKMNFNSSRAPLVHAPLLILAIVIAALTRRAIAFHWLALLVVIAELQIVLSRFIFSYEQAFMGDLGAVLVRRAVPVSPRPTRCSTDGHVRVDVLYSGFKRHGPRASVNAVGAILMGIIFLLGRADHGHWSKSSILINAPLISLEVSQSGFGMYVKYHDGQLPGRIRRLR